MNKNICPACTLDDILEHPDKYECSTCGHEWPKEEQAAAARVIKDANGNILADGDSIVLIQDLKPRSGPVLKQGAKAKNIRLNPDSDHEIDCKIEGVPYALKACYVKKS